MEGEEIVGLIPKTQVKPGLTDYNLLITNKRIIGGKVGSSGLGYIAGGVIGYAISRSGQDEEKYRDMDPEEVLNDHKKNFAWNFENDIKSIKIKDGALNKKIVIKFTSNAKHRKKTIFIKGKYFDDAKTLFNHVANDKII